MSAIKETEMLIQPKDKVGDRRTGTNLATGFC